MEARDQRALLKSQIALKGLPSLSLTLNIPGFPKSNGIVTTFFGYCLTSFRDFLKAHLVDIIEEEAISCCDPAGDFYLVPCSPGVLSMHNIKKYCEEFEQSHPFGRFIDADLNDHLGNSVSSGESKICFFCLERPAIECRRENAHDHEELRSFMFSKMEAYCREQWQNEIARKLSAFALKAILSEISLTPKPGLVDKYSNGSHTDMNFQTFLDSTTAISTGFPELVHEGFEFSDQDLTKALPLIRKIGLRMESAMFEATNGVNTQKGVIFLMGLSLFACGKLYGKSKHFNSENFRTVLQEICKNLVLNELKGYSSPVKSHGSAVFLKFGFGGAREEAESGFSMIFTFGLPQLSGLSELNDMVLIKCFLAIASNNIDTNILYRSSPEILHDFQKLCKTALDDFNDQNYRAVIEFCKNYNISPGGSADLLAVTIFVWTVIHTKM